MTAWGDYVHVVIISLLLLILVLYFYSIYTAHKKTASTHSLDHLIQQKVKQFSGTTVTSRVAIQKNKFSSVDKILQNIDRDAPSYLPVYKKLLEQAQWSTQTLQDHYENLLKPQVSRPYFECTLQKILDILQQSTLWKWHRGNPEAVMIYVWFKNFLFFLSSSATQEALLTKFALLKLYGPETAISELSEEFTQNQFELFRRQCFDLAVVKDLLLLKAWKNTIDSLVYEYKIFLPMDLDVIKNEYDLRADEEAKKNYLRSLKKKYHPDRLAGLHFPERFRTYFLEILTKNYQMLSELDL
jgi:hypothetical protein